MTPIVRTNIHGSVSLQVKLGSYNLTVGVEIELETSLHRASSIRNASVIIGGDFNLPGWDWRSTTLKPNATYPNLHQQFLDIINNNGLCI
jgi:endonuclease/exonuclease/phosphatase (EEP) superfamily protein YafD